MAVPKKRTGHSAQGHRRSNWKATKPEITTCKNCGQPALTHTVCAACGYYKGRAASIKSADYVETPLEPKKSFKKEVKTKKPEAKTEPTVEVKEETKITETVEVAEVSETTEVVEEVKAEAEETKSEE